VFDAAGVKARVQGLGARFGIYFGVDDPVTSYRDALKHQRETMLRFIAAAIRHGVYFHDYGGGACHHGFCAALTPDDADEALRRLERAVAELAG
jgi:glutamate-1-semialdehyde 2,1-aminomutase